MNPSLWAPCFTPLIYTGGVAASSPAAFRCLVVWACPLWGGWPGLARRLARPVDMHSHLRPPLPLPLLLLSASKQVIEVEETQMKSLHSLLLKLVQKEEAQMKSLHSLLLESSSSSSSFACTEFVQGLQLSPIRHLVCVLHEKQAGLDVYKGSPFPQKSS